MWIAACCMRHGILLATLNTKDFEDFADVDGLVLLDLRARAHSQLHDCRGVSVRTAACHSVPISIGQSCALFVHLAEARRLADPSCTYAGLGF
jgi:hypothetical protein